MKNLQILFLSFVLSFNSNCQSDALIRFSQDKIDIKIDVLYPLINGDYHYEKYIYFKHNYWLTMNSDTLSKVSDSIYRGKTVTINVNDGFAAKSPCDSLINLIRNSAASNFTDSQLKDSAKLYIGYDNTEFNHSFANGPSKMDEYSLCHEEFQSLNSKWFESQLELIRLILAKKTTRYEEIVRKDSVDRHFIIQFLKDFGKCEVDYLAILELIRLDAETLLRACYGISDSEFYSIKWKLSDIPSSINTELAIESLRDTNYKSRKKRMLIRKLKR